MKSKQLILLGPPGAGVEDQASALAKRWYVPHVSVGKLLREEVVKGTDLGNEVEPYVAAGEDVPDALVMKLMRRRIEQPDTLDGWVVTDFPRSLTQAEAFDELLLKFERDKAEVAYIKAMTGLLINRITEAEGPGSNVNDIRSRLTDYKSQAAPLVDYYQQDSRIVTINGSLSAAEVANELFNLGHEETGAAKFIQGEAELDSLLSEESLLVVDCVASWCGPCKQVSPLIDQLAEEYGEPDGSGQVQRAKVVKLDFDNNRQVAKRFGLKGMPSVMFFQQGELKETLRGVKSYAEYSETLSQLL